MGFALARLAFMATFGLGRDEAYTLVISRQLALSYFDHPPLHQWLAHASAIAFGENVWARLPFVALFTLTGWLLYLLTKRLYGASAALAALVALNATPFFFGSAGTWIVPDGPLLAALAGAALAAAGIALEPPTVGHAWRRWFGVGIAFGLAGLSKYTAALTALGLAIHFVVSPAARRWLLYPGPYAAALLALALVAPVFVWNAEHDWVSFRFQGGRGAQGEGAGVLAVIVIAAGQAGYLMPWVFAGLLAAGASAVRAATCGDERARFLLCLASPTILTFSLIPFLSGHGLPHWAMPGWFFLYPLLGDWLTRRGYGQRSAWSSVAFLTLLVVLVVTQTRWGWIERLTGRSLPDPTLESLAWTRIRNTPALLSRPAFVIATKWWEAGKVGLAVGPTFPIFVFSGDPRGIAFLDEAARYIGRDGVIVAERRRLPEIEGVISQYFNRLDPPEILQLKRSGPVEQELVIILAHDLTRAFPVP